MIRNHTDGKILFIQADDRHRILVSGKDLPADHHQALAARDALAAVTAWESFPELCVPPPDAIECGACHGLRYLSYETHRCDVCSGRGWLNSMVLARDYPCPACNDERTHYNSESGLIAIPKPGGDKPCPDCEGVGAIAGDHIRYAMAGLVVGTLYAWRIHEPGAEYAQVNVPSLSRQGPVLGFRTPSALGILMPIFPVALNGEPQPPKQAAKAWGAFHAGEDLFSEPDGGAP
jgi:hypothetical protein